MTDVHPQIEATQLIYCNLMMKAGALLLMGFGKVSGILSV